MTMMMVGNHHKEEDYIILILIAAKLWTEVFEREKPYTQLRNCEKYLSMDI